eukprot:g4208.t1
MTTGASSGPDRTIVLARSKLLAFDVCTTSKPEPAPSAALYNAQYTSLCVANGTHVRVWDASTGESKHVYHNIVDSEIVSMTFDGKQRKFFLATADGYIKAYNYRNSSMVKSNKCHDDSIAAMIFSSEDRVVITASWDRSIRVFDDTKANTLECLRVVHKAHSCDIVSLAFSHNVSLIASADMFGVIKLWDFQFLTPEGQLQYGSHEITCMAFLPHYPVLVTGDYGGGLSFWTVRPIETSSIPILCLQNYGFKLQRNRSILCMQVLQSKLTIGDNDGHITVWNLDKALATQIKSGTIRKITEYNLVINEGNYNARRKVERWHETKLENGKRNLFTVNEARTVLATLGVHKRTEIRRLFSKVRRRRRVLGGVSDSNELTLMSSASKLDPKSAFEKADKDGIGTLSDYQLALGLKELQVDVSKQEIAQLRYVLGKVLRDERFKYDEFCAICIIGLQVNEAFLKTMESRAEGELEGSSTEKPTLQRSSSSRRGTFFGTFGAGLGTLDGPILSKMLAPEPEETKQFRKRSIIHNSTMQAKDNEISERQAAISNELVIASWKAHSKAINTLQCNEDPECIVSCSADKFVSIWGLDGRLLCVVTRGSKVDSERILHRHKKEVWNFAIDFKERERTRKAEAKAILDDVIKMEIAQNKESAMAQEENAKLEEIRNSPLHGRTQSTLLRSEVSKDISRGRVLGQLSGEKTWNLTPAELAHEEAIKHKKESIANLNKAKKRQKGKKGKKKQQSGLSNDDAELEEILSTDFSKIFADADKKVPELRNYRSRKELQKQRRDMYPCMYAEETRIVTVKDVSKQLKQLEASSSLPMLEKLSSPLIKQIKEEETKGETITEPTSPSDVEKEDIIQTRSTEHNTRSKSRMSTVYSYENSPKVVPKVSRSASMPTLQIDTNLSNKQLVKGQIKEMAKDIPMNAVKGPEEEEEEEKEEQKQEEQEREEQKGELAVVEPKKKKEKKKVKLSKLRRRMRKNRRATFSFRKKTKKKKEMSDDAVIQMLDTAADSKGFSLSVIYDKQATDDLANMEDPAELLKRQKRERRKQQARDRAISQIHLPESISEEEKLRLREKTHFGIYDLNHVNIIYEMFRTMDIDDSNTIDFDEFTEGMMKTFEKEFPGPEFQEVRAKKILELDVMFHRMDKDKSGTLDAGELVKLVFQKARGKELSDLHFVFHYHVLDVSSSSSEEELPPERPPLTEEKMEELALMFRLIDKDGSGTVDIFELKDSMSYGGFTPKELADMFREADVDGSGELDFDEYVEMIRENW